MIAAGCAFLLLALTSIQCFAECEGNFDSDRDIDGIDLDVFIGDFGRTDCISNPPCKADIHPIGTPDGVVDASDLELFALDFSREDCPLPVPANLFNIGNSIGEGEAAYGSIGNPNHDVVWSTGFEPADIVYSLNERFEDIDPNGYYENNSTRDAIFNLAITGSEMAAFATQADDVADAASNTPSGKAGMVTILLGNNDVCAASLGSMTPSAEFESQYRAGLDILAASVATNQARIHVSGIPAIYWLWNAKRTDFLCGFIWLFVPCENLLDSPTDDCADGASRLDPDNIDPGDGDDCIRRKEFHAAIRDVYNPILRDVLLEYKFNGKLPNAYYVDILDIQFFDNHINDGDCFHPSNEGHAFLAEEQWRRSPWGLAE